MPTACINQPDCRIHLKSERLEVHGRNEQTQRDEVLREIPLRDLDRLIVVESVQITSQALAALLRANIPVNFLGWNGQFLGGFHPAQNQHGLARLRQYRQTLDPAFGLQMAGRIITAKLYNQRRVVQRLGASRNPDPKSPSLGETLDAKSEIAPAGVGQSDIRNPESDIQSTLKWLDCLFASLKTSRSIDELRGYEGTATARYFQAWATFLPAEFPFERRSTRPPLNPVNACVSFGATLLYTESVGHRTALRQQLENQAVMFKAALEQAEKFEPLLMN